MSAPPNVRPLLEALPAPQRQRLEIMGWPHQGLSDPDRLLRRAVGAPEAVSLVDLELDPERWHGHYVATSGTVGWSKETTCLGRVWLNPSLALHAARTGLARYPPVFQARIQGVLLADAAVRAAHRARAHSPGGYGHFGLFIAELIATSIEIEVPPPSARSAGRRPR
ncbi:MAG: hypothetical protein RMK29_17310 [Myxococcales bacterium]|nr:hypothetical protein [Myxococcota bacterium]MDW8283469.1 hypothetical protein [Myxococcales bacterium]